MAAAFSARSTLATAGAHTTPAAITHAQHTVTGMLARCGTLSLAQLVAAVDEPAATVVDAVLTLVDADTADVWRDRVDGHVVVGARTVAAMGRGDDRRP